MEKIQVKDELKQKYLGLVQGAQQMEQSIGSAEYRVYKMKEQRSQIDVELKTWWEGAAAEYKLDKGLDYYVDNEGNINQVEKPVAPEAPKAPATPEVPQEAPASPVDKDAVNEGGTAADLT